VVALGWRPIDGSPFEKQLPRVAVVAFLGERVEVVEEEREPVGEYEEVVVEVVEVVGLL
jgi:hypothetical protein